MPRKVQQSKISILLESAPLAAKRSSFARSFRRHGLDRMNIFLHREYWFFAVLRRQRKRLFGGVGPSSDAKLGTRKKLSVRIDRPVFRAPVNDHGGNHASRYTDSRA